ncbi:hypothetical protein [Sinomonas albida]|uniref:hypothetical protein n=1 Tax=Sinomonas albida TaxID=369942 RepID=UPI0030169A45
MNTSVPATPSKLLRRSREALSVLGLQFLLGMGTNLLGGSQDSAAMITDGIVLGLHILVGIGVIVVAIRLLLAARQQQLGVRAAVWALVILSATFLIGVGTLITGSGWLSFLMAVGWLAGVGLYIQTFVLATRTAATSFR